MKMLDGYNRIFNMHGLKQLDRTIDIPDAALGIGFAERHASTPLRISYEPVVQTPVFQKIRSMEDAGSGGIGEQVNQNQFPNTGWLGASLGVF